ncbi:MAG: 30S ribosomal protein S20 [Thermodesulfovibrionia bacterium]
MPSKTAPKRNKSALKRMRQSAKRALRNRSVKGMLKTLSKKVESAVMDKDIENATAALNKAISATDSAARKGIIHKNTAARKVSRLRRLVNSLSQTG